MAVDVLSSCYKRQVQLFRDDPTLYTVRWYFCDDAAKDFPLPRFVGSDVWSDKNDPPLPGLGVEQGPRIWDAGKNVKGYLGQCFMGTPDQWLNGLRLTDPPVRGRPPCCGPPPKGQAALSITPRSSWVQDTPVTTCTACPGGAARKWEVTVSGATGDYVVFNGTWIMTYSGACNWSSGDSPGVDWDISGLSVLGFRADEPIIFGAVYSRVGSPECMDCQTVLFQTLGPAPGTMPATLEVCPSPHPVHYTFAGDAGLRITPRSHWTIGFTFAGKAGLVITPAGAFAETSYSFAGDGSMIVTPRSSWASSFPTDCSACPHGIQPGMNFDAAAWTGPYAALAGGFSVSYSGGCTYTASVSGLTVTVSVGGAILGTTLTVDDGLGDVAIYQQGIWDCLSDNSYLLQSDTSGSNAPANIFSHPV